MTNRDIGIFCQFASYSFSQESLQHSCIIIGIAAYIRMYIHHHILFGTSHALVFCLFACYEICSRYGWVKTEKVAWGTGSGTAYNVKTFCRR